MDEGVALVGVGEAQDFVEDGLGDGDLERVEGRGEVDGTVDGRWLGTLRRVVGFGEGRVVLAESAAQLGGGLGVGGTEGEVAAPGGDGGGEVVVELGSFGGPGFAGGRLDGFGGVFAGAVAVAAGGLRLAAHFLGGGAGDALEGVAEGAGDGHADVSTDLVEAAVGLAHLTGGFFDAQLVDVGLERADVGGQAVVGLAGKRRWRW